MKKWVVAKLTCPRCSGPLTLQVFKTEMDLPEEVVDGYLACTCGQKYPIVKGIPRLVLGRLQNYYFDILAEYGIKIPRSKLKGPKESCNLTIDSFSTKWDKFPRFSIGKPEMEQFYNEWFAKKLGLQDLDSLWSFLREKKSILEAGIGVGQKLKTMAEKTEGEVFGIDLSTSVEHAYANLKNLSNAHVIQADIFSLPFKREIFDFIVSDGVLHHTPDPKRAFKCLLPHLTPGGDIAIHMYRKMGPIKEFCDDFIREYSTKLSAEKCWEFVIPFTELGKSLAESNVDITIPQDIPLLGIKAGKYNLHRFIYLHILKCFWNPLFSFEENNLVNFDWYHPLHAYRSTEEEVIGWFKEAGLMEVKAFKANENGVSVRGRKPK